MHQSGHCQRRIPHSHVFFLLFPFSFKCVRKLLTTPWKAQDIPAPIHLERIATSPFPFPWERICESTFKAFTPPVPTVGAAGK